MWGILEINSRSTIDVALKAACINIKPGGRLIAGEKDAPFAGKLDIQLSGDALTESAWCGGMKGKHLDVHGSLLLHAPPPLLRWTTLATTAAAGDQRIVVSGEPGWEAGDELVVATSGRSAGETELAIVTGGKSVPGADGATFTEYTLYAPLAFTHMSAAETHFGRTIEMRAEVGLLRRRGDAPAITIRGVDHNQPQYRFRAMHLEMAGVFLEVHEAEQARKDACDAHMWRELLITDGFLSAAAADVVFNRTAGGDLGLMGSTFGAKRPVSADGERLRAHFGCDGGRLEMSGVVLEDMGCHTSSFVCARKGVFVYPGITINGGSCLLYTSDAADD